MRDPLSLAPDLALALQAGDALSQLRVTTGERLPCPSCAADGLEPV